MHYTLCNVMTAPQWTIITPHTIKKNFMPLILTLKLIPILKTFHKIFQNLFHLLPCVIFLLPCVIFLSIAKDLSKIPCLNILKLSTYIRIPLLKREKKIELGLLFRGPTTTFGQKSTTFYFCLYSMQKPSKRVKTQ